MFKEILKKIEQNHTIILHRHVNPDPDALGSQLGLKAILCENYPEKNIYAVGETVSSLSYLGQMDEIHQKDYENSLVIVLDTANIDRIDGIFDKNCDLIKIDHHPNNEPYGNLCYVDTTASSTSEIIVDFVQTLQLKMTNESAKLLYAGIVGDTGRFLFSNTTRKTLLAVAFLRQYDFSAVDINRQMVSINLKIARFNGYVLQNLVISNSGVGHIILSKQLMSQFDVTNDDTNGVAGLFGNIDEVKCWVVFIEKEDGTYRARIRSKQIVINTVAQQFNGGGHPFASGANVKDEQEITRLLERLEEVVRIENE